jgi:hypothetical protein
MILELKYITMYSIEIYVRIYMYTVIQYKHHSQIPLYLKPTKKSNIFEITKPYKLPRSPHYPFYNNLAKKLSTKKIKNP